MRVFIILEILLFFNLICQAGAENLCQQKFLLAVKLQAEKAKSAGSEIKLHAEVDMLSSACAEAGITLASKTLPNTVKSVVPGSPAFYANIGQNDKIIAAEFKNNKLCLSLESKGKQYYTEINLSPERTSTTSAGTLTANGLNRSQSITAIGFEYDVVTRAITYVDPYSDLFGKVNVGDVYVPLNDGPLGAQSRVVNNETIVYPIFSQNGVMHYFPCRKKPVDSFSHYMVEKFRWAFHQMN